MIASEKHRRPYTWTELSERMIWYYAASMAFYQIGTVMALVTYAFGLISVPIKFSTILWAFVVGFGSNFGVTAGAHRLWAHRSYKANLPLRIILMILQTTSGTMSIYYWVRHHRVHHKYVDTDADPHSSERGFLFSHVLWVVMKLHPECRQRIKEVNMSDIHADGVVMFQKRYFARLRLLLCFFIPTLIPIIFWEETVLSSVLTQCFIRSIYPVDNMMVSALTSGEGSHNYHHTFPWDYKASEFSYIDFNTTTLLIDAFAAIGWAYDKREPSKKFVDQIVNHYRIKHQK